MHTPHLVNNTNTTTNAANTSNTNTTAANRHPNDDRVPTTPDER